MDFSVLKQRGENVLKHRRILWDLSLSQLKAKFAGLKLGFWWVLVVPLALAFCINFVFVLAFKVDTPHYTFFILSGLIPWFFISQAVSESAGAFLANKNMLRQGIFPREFIPLSSVLANFLNFFFGFLFILPLYFLTNRTLIFFLPSLSLVVFFTLVFALGLGLIFAALNTFFRDTAYFLSIGLMFWFWITPVFYSETMLDFPYRWVSLLNPATYFVSAFRKVLYYADPVGIVDMGLLFLISALTLLIGYFYYLKNEPEILKKI